MDAGTPRLRARALFCAGALALAGCTSLPIIVPDMATRTDKPVAVHGAGGPLSAARSRAVLDDLARRSPDTGIFDRHLAVEEALVGSPLTAGNRVQLLKDGPATYQAMFAAMSAARDHIHLET